MSLACEDGNSKLVEVYSATYSVQFLKVMKRIGISGMFFPRCASWYAFWGRRPCCMKSCTVCTGAVSPRCYFTFSLSSSSFCKNFVGKADNEHNGTIKREWSLFFGDERSLSKIVQTWKTKKMRMVCAWLLRRCTFHWRERYRSKKAPGITWSFKKALITEA